jgi:hypothetical protein
MEEFEPRMLLDAGTGAAAVAQVAANSQLTTVPGALAAQVQQINGTPAPTANLLVAALSSQTPPGVPAGNSSPSLQDALQLGQQSVASNPTVVIPPLALVSPLLVISPLQRIDVTYLQSGGGDNAALMPEHPVPVSGIPLSSSLGTGGSIRDEAKDQLPTSPTLESSGSDVAALSTTVVQWRGACDAYFSEASYGALAPAVLALI